MKKAAFLFLTFGLLTLAFSGLQAQAPPQGEDALTVKAREFLAAMAKGDFKLAARDFDETMLKASGPDKLEPMWTKQLPAQVGAFKQQGPARREEYQGYQIVLITCSFEKALLDARVVFDKEGKIAGLQFVPPAPPAKYEPPAYADASKFEETEVTVGAGEWALPGTLTMPKGPGPFPGLVLVHGSGPNDRDETLGPNKPFKDLAWGLATRGFAVLRYEKRSKAHGEKIKALTDADRGSTQKLIGAMPAYWLDLRGYDPPEAAKSVNVPMLFLQGGRDYQVTPDDLENWKKALGGRKDVEFRLYPKLNHFFFEGEGAIIPLEYMQKHGSVAPAVIGDIAGWIGKH